MGQGDAELDETMAELELDEMDDNMDGKLGKAEFMKWLTAKKSEIADALGGESTKASSKNKKLDHHNARDQNAWGSDPAHHLAATKIQAVARGRKQRKAEGEVEVIDLGNGLEMQENVRCTTINDNAYLVCFFANIYKQSPLQRFLL